jgi:rod shape-determining protein MreC
MNRIVWLIVFAFLLILALIIPSRLFNPVKNLYFLATKPLLGVTGGFAGNSVNVFNAGGLVAENRKLRNKLDHLERLRFERVELENENARLRSLLDFKTRLAQGLRKAIASQVIGRSPAGWRDTIVINKGLADGVQPGMPVVTYSGLLGRVGESLATTAKVRLITHPRFRVGALIQRTRHTGVVYGTVDGESRMKYLSMDADVQVGDLVETAGYSEEFPKGLLIGTIDRVWKEPGQIYRVASIKLAADIDRIEEVLCVVP